MIANSIAGDSGYDFMPTAEYARVCAQRDATQSKLSALAAVLQTPALTHRIPVAALDAWIERQIVLAGNDGSENLNPGTSLEGNEVD